MRDLVPLAASQIKTRSICEAASGKAPLQDHSVMP
jgi:hypothetical protein